MRENMSDYLMSQIYTGVLRWYPFTSHARILVIDNEIVDNDFGHETRESVIDWLKKEDFTVYVSKANQIPKDSIYDYVLLIDVFEYLEIPSVFLKEISNILSEKGKIIIVADNRFGIKYFVGDHDYFSDRSYDGIEGYEKLLDIDKRQLRGRSYSKYEMCSFLHRAGINNIQFFSVFPDIRTAQLIYSEDYEPNEDLSARFFPFYNHPDSVFLEERRLLNQLSQNNMFHQMADGYFIECSPHKVPFTDILHATISMDRNDDAMITIIKKDSVEKISLSKNNSNNKLKRILNNQKDLSKRGIKTVPIELRDDRLIMPYVDAIGGMEYFKTLAIKGKKYFLEALDHFYELILDSSDEAVLSKDYTFGKETVTGKEIRLRNSGKILKNGYPDMVPLNTFVIDGEFTFFDQEFVRENYPAKAIMYRVICLVIEYIKFISEGLTMAEMLDRYEMSEDLNQWRYFERDFCDRLLNKSELQEFRRTHSVEPHIMAENLEKINYSARDYKHFFIDFLDGCKGKEVVVFGTGTFAKRFLALFKDKLSISFMVDNDPSKHGSMIDGIIVRSPESLKEKNPESYKLIICIRQYVGVLRQIKGYGIKDYGIFDPDSDYIVPEYMKNTYVNEIDVRLSTKDKSVIPKKPYHIGYVAGVFDLFHVGHLNLLRSAKENCDYLIVGIVTDEAVRKQKKVEPVIPFKDRKAIVESCKYVDEVSEIPLNAGGSLDAYRIHHFDVQFSGSDYEHDSYWLSAKAELERYGSTIVFFPYTEAISSSKIKEKLKK